MKYSRDWTDELGCFGTIVVVILVFAIAFGLLMFEAWIFMLLWNWIVGEVIGWITFSFWEAVGVTLLLDIIGGFFKSSISVNKG